MTLILGTSTVSASDAFFLGDNDSIYVPQYNYVVSTGGIAIRGTGSNQFARIVGDVYGESVGVWIGDNSATDNNNRVWVYAGGSIVSEGVGVRVDGLNGQVYNEGTISGFYGVTMLGTGVGESRIINHGTISGYNHGIRHFIGSTEDLVVQNFGTITGVGTGIDSFSSDLGTVCKETILNRGSMVGFVQMGGGDDVINNRGGLIDGYVTLDNGNDLLDNLTGTISGTISCGAGNDTVIGNAAQAETIDGGLGTADVLDFRLGAGAVVALDQSRPNDGAAADDVYSGFEVIYGSNRGADVLIGGNEVNSFLGNGGNDWLQGGGGGDALRGGFGTDTLVGGTGNDLFRFFSLAEIGDLIVDFSSSAPGNDDAIQISAAAFGGGLVAGVLTANQFQNRADNVAQDADDRFIFRTTDRTLWFDADGNGAGAAVMVADMQASATMTAADILIL